MYWKKSALLTPTISSRFMANVKLTRVNFPNHHNMITRKSLRQREWNISFSWIGIGISLSRQPYGDPVPIPLSEILQVFWASRYLAHFAAVCVKPWWSVLNLLPQHFLLDWLNRCMFVGCTWQAFLDSGYFGCHCKCWKWRQFGSWASDKFCVYCHILQLQGGDLSAQAWHGFGVEVSKWN